MIPRVIDTHPGEEKSDDVNSLQPRSMSKQRARGAGSAGLSELSKQLRVFQSKNEAQAVEISRLERQLRILADLQGINVADLRKALEEACQNEAFGEMQSRVRKLRAELEAAMLAKGGVMRQDMAAPEIANLELRIGELEEVEEKQEREIHHLYEQLRHERARATRLESECDQWKKDTSGYSDRLKSEAAKAASLEKDFQDQLRKLQEEYARKMQEGLLGLKEGNANYVSPEMADEYEKLLQAMKEKDEALRKARSELQAEHEKNLQLMRDKENATRMERVDSQVENENRVLLIKQLQDNDSQNELRLAQYKTRFAVQDERINDMAQQLESLYTAFGFFEGRARVREPLPRRPFEPSGRSRRSDGSPGGKSAEEDPQEANGQDQCPPIGGGGGGFFFHPRHTRKSRNDAGRISGRRPVPDRRHGTDPGAGDADRPAAWQPRQG